MSLRFVIETLGPTHDRDAFSCGVPALDRYLKEQVGQDLRRRTTACYVAHEPEADTIAGYYTLSAGDISLQDLPEATAKRLPRYPVVPIARVGRLAIDKRHKRKGLGAALLWDAGSRARRSEMGVFALAVDAKDESARAFYRHLGFVAFASQPLRLFLPVSKFGERSNERR